MDSRQISEIRNIKYEIRNGSAIILAIVLTTLLAMLGVLFLLSSRVDSVATSAVGGNEDLKLAVDTVVAQISEVLTHNVPGVDPNGTYYDYPDPCTDFWLACLEPYYKSDTNDYRWRHVSDLYGMSADNVKADIVPEYQPTVGSGLLADADGDGVGDSIWVPIQVNGQGITSSKGKPIYAAVRIIDNGGMLNINTAYKFDPCSSVGSTQLDINLMALATLDNTHTLPGETQNRLLSYRCGSGPNDITLYTNNVVWQYGQPAGAYTPFDISDELNLRNRYIINRSDVTRTVSRIETLWTHAFDGPPYEPRYTPYNSINDPCDWFWIVSNNYPSPCPNPYVYDNRHIATTYNMDRIINPAGNKMFNINSASAIDKYAVRDRIGEAVLAAGLDPAVYDANQIAVNLIDYIDTDSNVTFILDPCTSNHYFGFETPCIYISEIAQNFYKPGPNDLNYNILDPNAVYRSYAIELFKPYSQDDDPNGWHIETKEDISATPKNTPIVWTGTKHFHVLANINPAAIDADIPIDTNDSDRQDVTDMNFGPLTTITLWRDVNGYGPMIVDLLNVQDINSTSGWMVDTNVSPLRSIERDINSIHRCIRRVLNPTATNSPTIGYMNRFIAGGEMIQAHPANKQFTNVGEIGQLFRTNAYSTEPNDTEATVRLNLADPNVQNIFKYLTVIDPYPLYTADSNETRIKGRININTAPWFVLAQLPWVTNPDNSISYTDKVKLAQAIVAYRDKLAITGGPDYYQGGASNARQLGMGIAGLYPVRENPGFASVGELLNVTQNVPLDMVWPPAPSSTPLYDIRHYGRDGLDLSAFPDLTPADGAPDDFEERDVIFDRISNLITVRSDVFTAYILVRIGPTGPQKRVIAILDRSGVTPTSGKVKIVAIQSVPDPR